MKCLVNNCFNNPGKFKPGISFHRLPKCQIKKQIWLENLGWKQKNQPSKFSIVCSEHFPADSFHYGKQANNKKARLSDNAIPIIVEKQIVESVESFRKINNQPTNKKKHVQMKGRNNDQNSRSINRQPRISNNPKRKCLELRHAAPLPVATVTVNKTIPNSSINSSETPITSGAPEKMTEILMQLSNLDTQNLKSIINNSNAKFESTLQAQARKKFRLELRKKLRSFNLNHNQAVNNINFKDLLDSGKISSDVLKKIEDVFKLDIFQCNDSNGEISDIIDESEVDDDIASNPNDVLTDTYMLLVKFGLIPDLSIPVTEGIGEMSKSSKNLPETNIINVDEIPSVPLVYEDSVNNITNDDVILIEPRSEIITIGSPEHETVCDEVSCDQLLNLPHDSETNTCYPNDQNQDISEKLARLVEGAEPDCLNTYSLVENVENSMCGAILTIIKEYNENLQKCYKEKQEIDSKITSLQSKKEGLENTIIQIQTTQTHLLELFLRKSSNAFNTTSQDSIASSTSSMLTKKRRLSTNSSVVLENDGNAIDQRSTTNIDFQGEKRNQDTSRNHLSEVKDIVKTNDYLIVSAGLEIFRYSSNNLELEKVYKRHRSLITGVYVLNNEYVFSVSLDMNLHKFSLEGFQNPLSTQCFKESLTALEYGWNNLFIGTSRGRIIAFSIDVNKICLDFHSDVKSSINTLKSVELSNKKYLTVLTSKSLYLYICDAQSGSIIRTIETFNYINDISIDNDSIYCGLNSNELLTFSIFSGRSHDPKELDTKSTIKCVKTYKNLVLVGCCDGYIHIYHKSTNLYLDLVRVTDKGLVSFEVYPRKIVFCSGDKSLTLNDMPSQITMYLE